MTAHTPSEEHPVVLGVDVLQPEALAVAIFEATWRRAPLRAVRCWVVPPVGLGLYVDPTLYVSLPAVADEVLREVAVATAAQAPDLRVEYLTTNAAPTDGLLTESKSAAVLVLGADHVSWLERFLGGEVAGHLSRHASCPVIVVPDHGRADAGGAVVVTIDGDTGATGPLRFGFEQADARAETLIVVHAVPAGTTPDDSRDHDRAVAEVLAGWQENYPGVTVQRLVVEGTPAQAAISASAEASIVIIGQHDGRRLAVAWARPVADAVMRAARCPVAVVPRDYERH